MVHARKKPWNIIVHRKKSTGKKGTEKWHRKKGDKRKTLKNGHKKKKNVFICKLLLLLFNEHLNYSMGIFLWLFVV